MRSMTDLLQTSKRSVDLEIPVSTMNVRTIREEHKQLELKYNFESHDLDILGIQEHRIMHDETVMYNTIEHSTLITTST